MVLFRSGKLFLFLLMMIAALARGQDLTKTIYQLDLQRINRNFSWVQNRLNTLEAQAARQYPESLPQIYLAEVRLALSQEDFDRAKVFAQKAEEAGSKSHDLEAKAYGYLASGYYFAQMEAETLALPQIKKAEDLLQKVSQAARPDLGFRVSYALYGIHAKFEHIETAAKYAGQSLEYARQTGDANLQLSALLAQTSIIKLQKSESREKALILEDSFKKAEDFYQLHKAEIPVYSGMMLMINHAGFLLDSYKKERSPSVLITLNQILSEASTLPAEVDYDYELRANLDGIRAEILSLNGQKKQAAELLESAIEKLGEKKNHLVTYTKINLLNSLLEVYKNTGNTAAALAVSESLLKNAQLEYDADKSREIRRLEMVYENQVLAEKLSNEHQANQLRNLTIALLLAILSGLGLSIYLSRRNLKQQRALETAKKSRAEEEKRLLKKKLELQQENKRRLELEKQVLQQEQQLLHREKILQAMTLAQNRETIAQVKEILPAEPEFGSIKKILNENERRSREITNKQIGQSSLPPAALLKLRRVAAQKLSLKEEELAAMLYLNFSAKMIAAQTGVEPKSVRMAKYRLKQKLALPAGLSLEAYIQSLAAEENSGSD